MRAKRDGLAEERLALGIRGVLPRRERAEHQGLRLDLVRIEPGERDIRSGKPLQCRCALVGR